jgi:hypothetical protein
MAKRTPANFVPRRPTRFRETEAARAVRAAKRAGGSCVEIDPETGKISIMIGKPAEPGTDNEVENWLRKQKQG